MLDVDEFLLRKSQAIYNTDTLTTKLQIELKTTH